jgi:hypothetical protein
VGDSGNRRHVDGDLARAIAHCVDTLAHRKTEAGCLRTGTLRKRDLRSIRTIADFNEAPA